MINVVDYAFLHGGGQGGWVWSETLAALQRQTDGHFGRALALDIPGCGAKRDRDTANLNTHDVAAELLSDLTRAGMRDIVLVGHSQAGTILPQLVEKRPELFRRLVYVSCCAPLPGQNIVQMMGSSQHGTKAEEVGWPLDPQTHPHPDQYPLMFCNDMNAAETSSFLSKLGLDMWPMPVTLGADWRYDYLTGIPSSYVVCLRDGILPVAWQEVFARRLKVERLVRIDAGHQVMNTRPRALAEILRHEASLESTRRAHAHT